MPPEAHCAAKAFREHLALDADRIKRVYQSPELRQLLNDWRKPAKRERAKRKIKLALAPAAVDDPRAALTITWLQPHSGLIVADHPTFQQSGIVVAAAHVSRVGKGIREASFPVVEIPESLSGNIMRDYRAFAA
ncbi:MAG TPA: hypothetical protein VJY34_00025 [Roseiarcus sp.]|nr:hypothetical protein [Roseiarcus sp.]